MHVYVRSHVYVCMYVCMYVCIYVCMYVYVCMIMYVCRLCLCKSKNLSRYVFMYVVRIYIFLWREKAYLEYRIPG
jgi:hypothetical protein